MTTESADALKAALIAVTALATCKESIVMIQGILREQSPALMKELEEEELRLGTLQEQAKDACRKLGQGSHALGGHYVFVKKAPSKKVVDVEALVYTATRKGELRDLIDAGVLKYEVVEHQIARLPDLMRARYSQYVHVEPGTAAVELPAELK